jgi:Leucine-rich repeat (LRR) protein
MAALIGGEQALSIIAKCAENTGKEVQRQLEEAWLQFDPEEFADRVLRRFDLEGRPLGLQDPSLLPGANFLDPQHLHCGFPQGHGNVDFITDLPNLQYLSVYDPELEHLDAVAEHLTLRTLTLHSQSGMVDLAPAARSGTLRNLGVSIDSIDLHSLRTMRNVEGLQFFDCEHPTSILPHLAVDLRLKGFGLSDAHLMADLSDLTAAPQLALLDYLMLLGTSALRTIAGIERWESMRTVNISAPKLIDVDRLGTLKNLEVVHLDHTPVPSLAFIKSSLRLRKLTIGGDDVTVPDLSPLCRLPQFRELDICGNDRFDISGLARAGELTVEIDGTPDRVTGLETLPDNVTVYFRSQGE